MGVQGHRLQRQTRSFLENAYSDKCVGPVPASSLAIGAGMVQYTCDGAVDHQRWYDTGARELRNVYSGECLGLGSGATGASELIQWSCNGASDEKVVQDRTLRTGMGPCLAACAWGPRRSAREPRTAASRLGRTTASRWLTQSARPRWRLC
ncbi:RICIN domain-containing protein [Streptomyces sp. NPDC003006]